MPAESTFQQHGQHVLREVRDGGERALRGFISPEEGKEGTARAGMMHNSEEAVYERGSLALTFPCANRIINTTPTRSKFSRIFVGM